MPEKTVSVLIVDDAPMMRKMLRDILQGAGYNIIGEAEDGVDGVAKFKFLSPDVTILDINMPKMDGIEALEEIMKCDPDATVIICSDIGMHTKVVEGIRKGAKEYIIKPFHPDVVIHSIERHAHKF